MEKRSNNRRWMKWRRRTVMERIMMATLMKMVARMRRGMILVGTQRWWLSMLPSRLCLLDKLRRWDKRWRHLYTHTLDHFVTNVSFYAILGAQHREAGQPWE